ncbi:unnamed protein product [Fusarium graminearum]|uniref:Chromosome 4, complete genome n=1 Tax=Gibberella zeae (strain ATCC MYA-4620 / CBS 123657 / FGSC 9075 / NRRL 31084 / PH-1) TaxID=229533 RepID=A0A098DUP4_GIBZE|nr:unnamed protein product [Fusarium graminearum]
MSLAVTVTKTFPQVNTTTVMDNTTDIERCRAIGNLILPEEALSIAVDDELEEFMLQACRLTSVSKSAVLAMKHAYSL